MGGRGSSLKQLPNYKHAEITRDKLKNYLLNPNKSPDKSKFFRELGYNMKNFRRLERDIRDGLEGSEAVARITNKYGHTVTAYSVPMPLGINKTAIVVTGWQRDAGSNIPRFITARPAHKKEKTND